MGRMIATDKTPVRVTGEPLHPIWWRGKQWAVTSYGIERLDTTYTIEASRLRETLPSWIEHVSRKIGPEQLAEFTTAFIIALLLHENESTRDAVLKTYEKALIESEQDEVEVRADEESGKWERITIS